MSIQKGERVYWYDPDGGTCSGYGKVVSDLRVPDILTIEKDDGGIVEAYEAECEPAVTGQLEKLFNPSELVCIIEFTRYALGNADLFDELADIMDLSDDEMISLRDKINQFMFGGG